MDLDDYEILAPKDFYPSNNKGPFVIREGKPHAYVLPPGNSDLVLIPLEGELVTSSLTFAQELKVLGVNVNLRVIQPF
jgi:hypothetical protein